MRLKRIIAGSADEVRFLQQLKDREETTDEAVVASVRAILANVRSNGEEAVRSYGLQYDGVVPQRLQVPREAIEDAWEAADPEFRAALELAAANIRSYHEPQKEKGYRIERGGGSWLEQRIFPLDRVGLYVPGGTAAYPSSVLMNAIPARIAGVREIVLVTPPQIIQGDEGPTAVANSDLLAAAWIAGIDRIFLCGGAQAVAALAYGAGSIPRVDKIVGPGNIYVATAKRLLYGTVDIDMIAGPSEILVLADETGDPAFVAADLLSQAEHDVLAASILLTSSPALAEAVDVEVERQLGFLERAGIAREALENCGASILCRDEADMIRLAERIAPEHLEILTEDPVRLASMIRNAGSVFLGPYAPEPLGDYLSGTNHVLPTAGTARYASPLGVYSFMKRMSVTSYSKASLEALQGPIRTFAAREGLDAHGNAVRIRFEEEKSNVL